MPQVYHIHGQMEMGLALLKTFFVGNLKIGMKIDCLYQMLQIWVLMQIRQKNTKKQTQTHVESGPIRDRTDARVNFLYSRDIFSITVHLIFKHTITDLKVLCRSVYIEVLI